MHVTHECVNVCAQLRSMINIVDDVKISRSFTGSVTGKALGVIFNSIVHRALIPVKDEEHERSRITYALKSFRCRTVVEEEDNEDSKVVAHEHNIKKLDAWIDNEDGVKDFVQPHGCACDRTLVNCACTFTFTFA